MCKQQDKKGDILERGTRVIIIESHQIDLLIWIFDQI